MAVIRRGLLPYCYSSWGVVRLDSCRGDKCAACQTCFFRKNEITLCDDIINDDNERWTIRLMQPEEEIQPMEVFENEVC